MTGPLAGVRVLDMATLYAGPLVATLLADHGADVVKVEPLAGDGYRDWPAMWAIVGRGKRSLTVDVATPAGADVVRRLLPHVDVVVENLPARVAAERGLTADELRAENPALVVVSATGFGHTGPYAGRPANGTLGEALGGLTYLTGERDGPPTLPSVPLGDVVAALFGAMGALAGVVQHLRTGAGAHVEVTVFEPILHLLGPALTGYRPGTTPPGRDGGSMTVALRGTFPTGDGRWLAMSCSTERHTASAAAVVGGDTSLPVRDRAAAWIASRPLDAALAAFVAARVPAAPVNDLAAVVDDAQVAARRSLVATDGTFVPAPVPRVGGTAPPRWPVLGDANDDLLRGVLGLHDDDLADLRAAGVVG